MGTGARMLRTFVGCCAWLLYGLSAAAALPVPTEGPFSTGTALPSAAESQAPRALVLGTAETSTAAPLPLTTVADTGFAASLADGLLGGGPTSLALPTGAELSDAATAASEYGPLAATTASGYSPRSAAGSDAEAAPSPPEPGETQVSAGDPQALTNATRSVNVSQENEAPAAEAASFSTREPLSFPSAEPNTTGAAPDTSFGTTLASPRFVDEGKNMSASVTREGAEGLQPIADTTPVPGFPSPSASGTQPTSRATGYPAANSPLGPGITTPPSRGLDMATTGVSKEGVTLPAGFQSGASSPSLSPNPEKLLATRQDEQASEATHVTQEPAGETAPAAEEGPALLEAGNAGDATGDATGAPDLSHPSLGSESVSGAVGNPGETSHLAGKTEPSLDTSPGPDRLEQGSPGVDLDNPSSAPPPAASEVLAAPAEPDVRGVPASPATAALPAHTVPLPAEAVAAVEPSLLPVPWDAAAGGVPAPADIPDGSSSSPTSSSTADYAQPAPGAVASSLSGADDGAEVLASPNLSAPAPLSPGESELQGTAAGDSVGAGLSSDDGPGAGLNPALGDPSLASPGPTSPVLGDWLGPEQPVVVASEAGTAEQALGGGGSTARGELSPSSAPVSETGIDQATGSPSDPASSSDVAAASSIPETDGAGPIPEAAPGPDSLSQASLASEDVPDLTAAPADSPLPAPGAAASTLSGGDNGAETPAGPNLGPEPLSLGGSEPQGTVSGSPEGAGSLLAHGSGTSSNPALDASSSAAFGAEGRELPGASLGLPAEEGSEAAAAEQELGGGGSAAGAASSSGFIPGSETAFGIVDTGSPSGPSSSVDVAAASAISEPDGAGLIPEVTPGAGGLSQGSLASNNVPDLAAAPADSPLSAPGAAASTLPGGDNGAETSAGPNLGPEPLSLGGSEPQGTVSGSPEGAGSLLPHGSGTSSNPALDASSSAAFGAEGRELPGASLGLPAEEGSEAAAAEQELGGGGSAAGAASSSAFMPGSETAFGIVDTGSPSGPSSPIDVTAASAVSEPDGAGPIPEAAPDAGGLSQASLASEGGPHLAAALGAETAGDVAGTEVGNPVSTSPDMDTNAPEFSPQQDPAVLGELPAGEAGGLTDSELSPPPLRSGAGEATALGEPSLPGPVAPGSAGLDPDLGTDAVRGDSPGQSPSAFDSAQRALSAAASTLPGGDNGAETPAGPSLRPEPLSLGGSELQGTVSGSPEGAGSLLAHGPGTSSNPALDASSSASFGAEGRELPGASLGLPAEEGSEAAAAEQELGGGGSTTGAASSSGFIPGSETALGTEQLLGTRSPPGPSSPVDVAAASAISQPDGAGPIPEVAPGPEGPSQGSLASEDVPDLTAAPADSPLPAPGPAASTLSGGDNGAETPAGPNLGPEPLSLGGSEPQGTALDASSSAAFGAEGRELPGASLGLPAEEGSEAAAAEQELGGGGSTAGAASSSAFMPGSETAFGIVDTGSPSGPSSPIDVAAASSIPETDGAGPIPEVAPGSDGLSQASLASEDVPDLTAAPADSPLPAPGAAASTLPGGDNGAETSAGPNLGPEPLSLGGSEPQGTVSGSPEGAGSLLAHGPGTSSNPALDASSSASFGAEGRELPGASLGLPAEEGSEAAAAEQELGGGGSTAGAASSSAFMPGSETAFGIVDTGSPSGPSSPIDVAAASAVSEPDGAGPIPEVAPGAGGLSQGSLASEDVPDLAAAPADSPLSAPGPAASTLPGGDNGAETSAGSNLSSALVPSLEGSESQRKVGSTSYGSDLSGSALNPALEVPSPASSSLGGAVLSVPQGSPGGGPGLTAVEGSEASTVEQILGGGGSTAGAEQPPSSALGTSKVTGTDQLPDAGSPSGSASASDVAAAPSVWDTASVSSLRGAPSAPGLSQPSSGGAPASGGAQPELPPATGEADELAKAVPGERASPGQSQGSAVEGTSVSGAFDGAGSAVENSAPSALSVGGSSSLGTASTTTEQAGLPSVSGGAGGSNTAASGLGSSGNKGAPLSAPGIQSASGLGASEAKLSQASVVELPGGERGVSANNEASLSATLGARGIVQAAPGVLAPSALASSQQGQALLPPALDAGVATAGIASLLGSSLLLPGHGLGASPASLEGARGSSGLMPKEKSPSPSSIHSGSSLAAAGAPLPAAEVLHGPLAGAETALPWSPEGKTASGLPAPSGEGPPSDLASPNAGPAVPPAAEGLSPGSRFSSPGSTSDLTAGPSVLEKGPLGVASAGPYGPTLLLPAPHPKSPGVPFSSVAAEGRGDADSPGQPRPGLPGAVAGSGAAAQLSPRVAAAPPVQSSIVQSSTGGSSGLAPVRIAAGNPLTKFPGAGSAGGSSPVVPQPPSSSKVIAGLSNGASAGPAAAASNVHGPVPGQGAARGGTPVTTRPPVSCSPEATVPTSQASLRKVLPEPGANGAAALPPPGSSNAFPAPMARPVAPAAPLPMTTAVPLYAYGTRENDREYVERRVDFNSPLFKPETGFPFGNALRNSLYFTDNGQIIFPTSDKNIFSYPNPPPGGFNGREKVPMIAVFWDDADFSRGVGTIFYQEFLTLNTAKPPFIQDVEAKIQRYMKSSYSAVWTLKITWVKAPAHTARTDTRRTSTYQAVLTTDGFRSYVLILYQDGGMGWDYSQLSATNVLIGYSSGDGFYHNDDLTQRPPAAKYRPDQFKGSNTDLRGLWIYKLESRVGPNFRLKCLAWTGREQDPRVWSQGLPSCPCSLQEGQRDSHFRSARKGRLNNSPLTMLHSALPNQRGAGVRCLYDSQGRFTEGRQERYWRPFRQASPYRDQELKLHHWCCNHPGSPKLCARYSEKRPEIGCGGHRVPSTGWFPARLPWRSSEEKDSDSEEREDDDEE